MPYTCRLHEPFDSLIASRVQAPNKMVLQIDRFRVEARDGFSMPCVTLRDRRAGGQPLVRFLYQRHLETVLYGRIEGSSGPIWKLLNGSGLGATALSVNKAAVTARLIEQSEFDQLMQTFKEALPAGLVDPCSLGRIRNCTLLPVATAAAVARGFGRSPASMAFLRALSQPVPEAWSLQEEHEANLANGQVDLVLEEQIQQGDFEAEEVSFAEELTQMPAFSAVADDETRMQTYAMTPVPSVLKHELDAYLVYRTETFAARRQGGAVLSISAEQDKTSLLRFFGYLQRTNRLPEDRPLLYLDFLLRADLGDLVQAYASWLQTTQRLKFSSIANYLNGLVSLVTYAYANLEPPDAVLNSDPNPLAQIINLRAQAEKASKTQQMYEQRVGGWLTWEDVQKARVQCMDKLDEAQWGTPAERRFALRDAAAISLLSLIPPDRVGCIRKLRLVRDQALSSPLALVRHSARLPRSRVKGAFQSRSGRGTRSRRRRVAGRWTSRSSATGIRHLASVSPSGLEPWSYRCLAVSDHRFASPRCDRRPLCRLSARRPHAGPQSVHGGARARAGQRRGTLPLSSAAVAL